MRQLLMFILLSAMLCWFMFAPIYKHVIITRQALLQQEVDTMLEIGTNASHGYIDAVMVNQSKQRLGQFGFQAAQLTYSVSTDSGVDGNNPTLPVVRGTGIILKISYPYDQLFTIDRLIGITPPPVGTRMGATGLKMSEYVP